MAQTGFTPIQIYSSSTAAAAPLAANLANSTLGSELAINITDGKLFYKDNANVIQVIAWKVTPTTAGGTGLTTYNAGDLLYYVSGTTLSKLAIGTTGQYLASSGTAPQWNSPAALTKTDDTNVTLTLGGSPSTALLNAASLTLGWTGQLAVTRGGTGLSTVAQGDILYGSASNTLVALAKNTTATRYLANTGTSNNPAWSQVDLSNGVTGTLPVGNGGTGQTTFTSGRVLYGNATSGINSDPDLYFDGANLGVGTSSPNRDLYILGSNSNGPLIVYNNASSTNFAISLGGSGSVNGVATGANAAACLVVVNKDSGSTRSINAAGSINANGADYAEYMTKCGDFVISKGEICGINEHGLLTNKFAEAITFVVKSTNPSYVGGDDWFIEQYPEAPILAKNATDDEKAKYEIALAIWQPKHADWKARMEEARQKVDRIAFSGQVPVNVMNAAPGQYIVPIQENDGISGAAVNNPTFEQYQSAIGRVIAIEPDGRAKIIVKIA